jgi:hypothetical protein
MALIIRSIYRQQRAPQSNAWTNVPDDPSSSDLSEDRVSRRIASKLEEVDVVILFASCASLVPSYINDVKAATCAATECRRGQDRLGHPSAAQLLNYPRHQPSIPAVQRLQGGECWIPVPIAAPVFLPTNCLCRIGGREKGQLPGGFAGQVRGFLPGTIRQFSLRMAFSLRSLRVVGFTLQAFFAF